MESDAFFPPYAVAEHGLQHKKTPTVGWVERSETHRPLAIRRTMGFAALYPSYGLPLAFQRLGSKSSTLFPSGSMIHANFPFSCDSGPPMIATPASRSRARISSRSSTRSLIMPDESLGMNHWLCRYARCTNAGPPYTAEAY